MSHCHGSNIQIDLPEGGKKIVLAGNPNVGKSVFFNTLTGMYVDVSNYPGTTLDISHGKFKDDLVIDTPGVYGISSFNDEERIARDVILSADLVLNVVDAVHLERDLFLTQQIIDTGVPVIIALNMIDDAEKQGIKVDAELLSDLLGVPVYKTVAVECKGISEVIKNIYNAKVGNISHSDLTELLINMNTKVANQGEALLILEGDPVISERHGVESLENREEIYVKRRERVNYIVGKTVTENKEGVSFKTKLGRWMITPITGFPILFIALYLMYQTIGVFVAQTVVGFTEETIMGGIYEPFVRGIVGNFINIEHWFGYILAGEYGVLTMTVTYVLGLLMPLVVGFYFFLSTFEDSGYLPRIAALTDRLLSSVGLNGRAIIPMILGFGCVTLATVVTRMLGSVRERRIAIFLLALAIPCSAQLGVIVGLLAGLSPLYIMLYVIVIISVMAIVGTLLNRLLPGKSTDLLIDLPPLRLPRLSNVLKKTYNKSYAFLKEAFPLFAFGAFLISVLNLSGALTKIQEFLAPLIVGWLNLPKEAATAFVMGIVRRDFGAAGLTDLSLEPLAMIIALIVITLFVPCIAAILVLFKERNKTEAAIMWFGSLIIAFLVGGVVNKLTGVFANENTGIIFAILIFMAGAGLTSLLCKIRPRSKTNIKTLSQEG
ncbi:ferrous iron transport protein B [Desulfonispora thiosulfatigenes DSM 11270]|uniref:Ferrous iron transport protein B n=1 Tax=Desulfonispora thiosulfatigenes DSM 11270 TaxID=656914 RepID=A0A1W1VDJ4_DESTI|nr:ferrous iron transport protein B [Desulfonispora thiosulfatigenes]SMB91014.1 ferrous iron transport protein B [Desulfonispora thiosulfatigenes DSM 11270]